jgi:hypothetical protein
MREDIKKVRSLFFLILKILLSRGLRYKYPMEDIKGENMFFMKEHVLTFGLCSL